MVLFPFKIRRSKFWMSDLRCLFISDPSTFGQNTSRIQQKGVYATLCLQYGVCRLDEASLLCLAKFFDPSRPVIWAIISGHRVRAKSIEGGRSTPVLREPDPDPQSLIEMFLKVLLALAHIHRRDGNQGQQDTPWRQTTQELFGTGIARYGNLAG